MNFRFIQVLTILAIVILYYLPAAQAQDNKRIFIIHSYENGHICGQPQHDGALKALADAGWVEGKNLEVGVYHMDTKRKNNTPELIKAQAVIAKEQLDAFHADVVLTLDDNAFRTIAHPASKSSQSYVFSGLNGQPETYNFKQEFLISRNYPGHNITGVYEKLYIREAIEVLSNMHPINTLLYLGDRSPTGKAISTQFDLEIASKQGQMKLPAKVDKKILDSWEDFTAAIELINKNTDMSAFYLGTLLLKDKQGKVYTAPEIINYTLEHAHKPAIGLNYAFIKLGLFGGATVDFYAMGQLAGEKAAQILNGIPAGSLPIDNAPRMALVFNLQRAEELGLTIPADILMAADEVFRK